MGCNASKADEPQRSTAGPSKDPQTDTKTSDNHCNNDPEIKVTSASESDAPKQEQGVEPPVIEDSADVQPLQEKEEVKEEHKHEHVKQYSSKSTEEPQLQEQTTTVTDTVEDAPIETANENPAMEQADDVTEDSTPVIEETDAEHNH